MLNKTVLLLLLAAGSIEARGESLTGTWKRGNVERGGGTLLVVDGPAQAQFQLELWRGAPSYNMGFLEGQLMVKEGTATFVGREAGWVCEIAFEFRGDRATLRQTGSDAACGFGHGVQADGTYRRTSRKKPVFQKPPE